MATAAGAGLVRGRARRSPPRSSGPTGCAATSAGLDVVLVGIGAIIGAGIFVCAGQAAATEAGRAITLS